MALFTGKADGGLPLLTQFFALELPDWSQDNPATLWTSELHRWLFPKGYFNPLLLASTSEEEMSAHQSQVIENALVPLAELHQRACPMMLALANNKGITAGDVQYLNDLSSLYFDDYKASLVPKRAAFLATHKTPLGRQVLKAREEIEDERERRFGRRLRLGTNEWLMPMCNLPDNMALQPNDLRPDEHRNVFTVPVPIIYQVVSDLLEAVMGKNVFSQRAECHGVFVRKKDGHKECSQRCRRRKYERENPQRHYGG